MKKGRQTQRQTKRGI